MNLIVGCPVSSRSWILPEYFYYTKRALDLAKLNYNFIFLASMRDNETLNCIYKEQAEGTPIDLLMLDEPYREDLRRWNPDRYKTMVTLRNALLRRIRIRQPDLFLSLDSDILLDPYAIKIAIEEINDFDALGLCVYMTPGVKPPGPVVWEIGREHTSKGSVVNGRLTNRTHYESEIHTTNSDVIMAAKLMKPSAYSVDYSYHCDGEDIGWSLNCKELGLQLGWCPSAKGKHIYNKSDIKKTDSRVGF